MASGKAGQEPLPSATALAASSADTIRFAEFFAGIGLVRAALEPSGFQAVWANDIEKAKYRQYSLNHPAGHFVLGDIRSVHAAQLPDRIELATSSFPCIDVSLAGNRLGLAGKHSGLFWEFARIIEEINETDRPRVLLLENVIGFASSHGGKDIRSAITELNRLGYSCDALAIDARHFVPQSRPRMFIAGIRSPLPRGASGGIPECSDTRPSWIRAIYQRNPDLGMHYFQLPRLPNGPDDLSAIVEQLAPGDPAWWDSNRAEAFIASLSEIQFRRFELLKTGPEIRWRTAYRRTRQGKPVWEIRRDGIAGCLRTTGGGSSRQALVEAGEGRPRIRWMTPREYARLMGAGDYKLDAAAANQTLFAFGDAVVVDVINWIGQHYLRPVLRPDSVFAPSESQFGPRTGLCPAAR